MKEMWRGRRWKRSKEEDEEKDGELRKVKEY